MTNAVQKAIRPLLAKIARWRTYRSKTDLRLDRFCDDLQAKLGPFGYQWLCACAVYPTLRFSLSTYLGKRVASALHRPPPDEDEHLALFQLTWFRTGKMQNDVRIRLVSDLVPEAREAARQAIEQIYFSSLQDGRGDRTNAALAISPPPIRWREQVRNYLEFAPAGTQERDRILARFMAGRSVSRRQVQWDRILIRNLGHDALGWFDRRTVLGGLSAIVAAYFVWHQASSWLLPFFEQTVEKQHSIETFKECAFCPEMVVIPAGMFMMGSPLAEGGRHDNESPRHAVRLQRFAIGRYEVTFNQWDACVDGGGCERLPSDFGWGRGIRPVVGVSQQDAKAYASWLSNKTDTLYRLPSEAEWEYAARGGQDTAYWWGREEKADLANYGHRFGETTEVGSFVPNAFGLFDTAGNAWEWIEDTWHDNYEGAPSDGRPWLDGKSSKQVIRGGSWNSDAWALRSAGRDNSDPSDQGNAIGFRLVRPLKSEEIEKEAVTPPWELPGFVPQISDRRLKTNVQTVGRVLDDINAYRFQYRGSSKCFVGLIAQDLLNQTVYREFVTVAADGFYRVDYSGLGLRQTTCLAWQAMGPKALILHR